jgi:hypothetical protein
VNVYCSAICRGSVGKASCRAVLDLETELVRCIQLGDCAAAKTALNLETAAGRHRRYSCISYFVGSVKGDCRVRPSEEFARLFLQVQRRNLPVQCLLVKCSMQDTENMGKHGVRCLTVQYGATSKLGHRPKQPEKLK